MMDGRLLEGTAKQIVQQMHSLALPVQHLSLAEYIEWVVANTLKWEGLELQVSGETDDERARSLVDEMLRTELAIEA
jgi:hypothetical protein